MPEPNEPLSFGNRCMQAIAEAKSKKQAQGGVLMMNELAQIIDRLDAERKATVKPAKPRNLLLDALVSMNGADPMQATPPMFSQAAKALKDIHAVSPNVTASDILRRAANYRKRWPQITLSPSALAKWWGECESDGRKPQVTDRPDFTRI